MTNVLVVDDIIGHRETFRAALRIEGFDVYTAEDGAQALSMINRMPRFDLILLDDGMPGMTGRSCYQNIPAVKQTKVIFLTVLGTEREFDRYRSGNTRVLVKPITSNTLIDEVRQFLDER